MHQRVLTNLPHGNSYKRSRGALETITSVVFSWNRRMILVYSRTRHYIITFGSDDCVWTGDARRDGCKDSERLSELWCPKWAPKAKSHKWKCLCCFLFSFCDVKICRASKFLYHKSWAQETPYPGSQLSKLWLWAPCCILTTQWPIKNFRFGPFKKKEVLGPPSWRGLLA